MTVRLHALASALLFSLAACGAGDDAAAGASSRSEPAVPSVEVVSFDGLDAALAARRGEGLLLNFWAIWCAPCVAEMPELAEVARAYRDRGGRVVGLSYDLMIPGADPDRIDGTMRAFLKKREIDFPVLVYDEDDYEAINERFELPGEVPVTLAIDKTGRVVDRQHGRAGKERFDEMMRKALGM